MGFAKDQDQEVEGPVCQRAEGMEEAEASTPSSGSEALANQPKPTCAVQPYSSSSSERMETTPGFTGLMNIGNTCFLNSTLQVLINTREIREYFLKKYYLLEINEDNPLGMKGELAAAFADFVSEMWSGRHFSYNPVNIKSLVSKKSAQFTGFAQHDAQEFLSFLLDGLHEDLNRIIKKPMTEIVEGHGKPDIEVAQEAWRRHKLRNDSVIVDLFHGQLKSRLQCPRCSKVSVTFDPFLYLPVPFPKKKCSIPVYFWPVDHYTPPWKVSLSLEEDAKMVDLYKCLEQRVNVPPKNMRAIESFYHKIYQEYGDEDLISSIRRDDVIFVFQVHDPEEAGEEVVELKVIQRLTCRTSPVFSYPFSSPSTSGTQCAACGETKPPKELNVCTECYKVYYCDRKCQVSDWNKHGTVCSFPKEPELVGHPFIVSLPRSQLSQSRLKAIMEARAQHSIELFMSPMDLEKVKSRRALMTEEEVDENLEPSSPLLPSTETMEVDPPTTPLKSTDSSSSSQQSPKLERRESSTDEESLTPPSRVRIVFGRTPLKSNSYKLFNIRGCDKDGVTDTRFHGGKALFSKGDGIPTVEESRFIGMDWLNKRGTKDFLKIDNKALPKCREMKSEEKEEETDLTLDTLLSLFTETETLSNEEAWRCPNCKDDVNAEKKLALWDLPNLVILQLKRFVYSPGHAWRSKNERHVSYPISGLDLTPYLCEKAPEQNAIYDLYGVVCHSGSSFFGHYISVGRLIGEDDSKTDIGWRKFDDSRVFSVTEQHALMDSAYLLFYRKRGAETKDMFKAFEEKRDEIMELDKAMSEKKSLEEEEW